VRRKGARKRPGVAARIARWAIALTFGFAGFTVGSVGALRWVDPPASAFMVREHAAAWWTQGAVAPRYCWVDWDAIAPSVKLAVVAAEDQKFPVHHGFDVQQIAESLEEARDGGRLRGASTISQQMAKNLFLWPGQSWVRKGLEAYLTLLVETLWPKRRILEVYLNVAELGRGIYGVEAATQAFFGKPAARLDESESALLAAVLPSPKRLRVDAPSAYVRSRQSWILGQMRSLGGSSYLHAL